MSPMDIFDTMLETIQQFPLECNRFERKSKRLHKDQSKYTKRFEKMAFKLVAAEDEKFRKVTHKLKQVIKERIKITTEFEQFVNKHNKRLQDLVQISSIDPAGLNITTMEGHGPAVIKLPDTVTGVKKYCICRSYAHGTMVCCENPSCTVRWHHLSCVDMQTAPKEPWKCNKCTSLL